jgi:hypothetical protein
LIDVHAIPIPDGAVPPDAVVATIGDVLAVLPLDRQEASVAAPNRSTAEQPASA